MQIQAITKRNQKAVNKAVKALLRYNEANELRDKADNEGNTKEFNKYDRICQNSFDAYLDACEYLPKREVKQIEKLIY